MQIAFETAVDERNCFSGPVGEATFGSEQYQWHSNIDGGTADPDGPIAHSTIIGTPGTRYTLPKASVTVLPGKIPQNSGNPPEGR